MSDQFSQSAAAATTSFVSIQADTSPPRLLSVKLHEPATRITNADSLTWRVTFSERVQNLDPSDFLATVTTATVTGLVPVDDYTYEVTVSGGDLASRNGTITLQLAANHDVSDLAGNPVANRQGDIEEWYNLDNLPPSVAAISRFEPAGAATAADSVTWRVQFTENVTDVDIGDFMISGTSATITRFARPFGIIADITISGGDLATMDGTVKLGFAPGHEIYDQAGNRLLSTAPLYGDQSSYTIDNTAPRVTSIVRQAPLDAVTDADELVWRVTFSEAVANLDPSDFTVSGSTAGVTAVTPAGGNAWNVKVAGGDLADYVGQVTLGFAAGQDVADVVGHGLNPMPSGANETSYTIQPPPRPPLTVAGALAFSHDTGVLGNDLVTRVGVQTVSGSLSAGLGAGEWVQVSLDGGQNWQTASSRTGDTTWELAGQILTGSGTLQVKVSNAGGDGPVASRAYVLDTAAPPLASVSVDGASVTLVYGEALGLAPALELFTVSAGGVAATISGLALDAAGNTLTLTLAVPVLPGQAVTLSYRAPDFGREQDAVQDEAGNGVAPFSDYAIANLTQDTTPPTLVSATVNGAELVMRYSEALDAVHPPLPGAFTVLAGGLEVAVRAVAVDGGSVILTLAAPVAAGQAVTVAYRDPSPGDDPDAIQDAAGNDAASLAATAAGNATPAPPTPTPPLPDPGPERDIVDGVRITKERVTNPDGSVSTLITVPVLTADMAGADGMADIPLVDGAAGALLLAQVPAGFGLRASGVGVKDAGDSLTDLVREIRAHAQAADREGLIGEGGAFLAGLPAASPVLVHAVTPLTGGASSPAGALVLAGDPRADGAAVSALVIDGRALPQGAAIALKDIGFAVIGGAVTVQAGAGTQHLVGDSAGQTFVVDGGGATIDGGAGRDTVQFGGAGRSGHTLRVKDGQLVVSGEQAHALSNVEVLRFVSDAADTSQRGSVARLLEAAGQQADLLQVDHWLDAADQVMSPAALAATLVAASGMDRLDTAGFVDALYRNALGREADAGGKAFWSAAIDGGQVTRAEVLARVAGSQEKLAQGQVEELDVNASEVALLVRMYEALFARRADEDGLNFWLGRHEDGVSLQRLADAFLATGEAVARYGEAGDAQFVAMLYRSAFDRDGSAAEQSFWTGQLASGALDRGDVLLNFANSGEMIALVGAIDTSVPTQ